MHSILQEKYSGVQSSVTGTTMNRTLDPEDGEVTFTRKKLKKVDVEDIDHKECKTSHTTIHNLPPEVLLEIFSCFTVRELCLTISPVCKIWHLYSQHNCLWKHLSFEGHHVSTEHLCLLLSRATQLQSLQLVNREDATAVLRQVARSNRRLQILIVKDCGGSPQTFEIDEEVLLKLIKSCSKLVKITIKESHFYSEAFFEVMAISLPDLKEINFNGNFYFGSRSLNIIACKFKPLEKVCVNWDKVSRDNYPIVAEENMKDIDINELCTRMKNSLKILKINARKLTDSAIKSIVQCTCLNTLRLHYARYLTDDGILHLTSLQTISSLEILSAYSVSAEGWHELFVRSKWNSLRKLYLIRCFGVDDNVLEIIAGTYQNLQRIHFLGCVNFTDNGLSKLIKACNQLEYLGLDCVQINIFQCFPLIPIYIPNLRRLDYSYYLNDAPELMLQMVYDLQKKLPNLIIRSNML